MKPTSNPNATLADKHKPAFAIDDQPPPFKHVLPLDGAHIEADMESVQLLAGHSGAICDRVRLDKRPALRGWRWYKDTLQVLKTPIHTTDECPRTEIGLALFAACCKLGLTLLLPMDGKPLDPVLLVKLDDPMGTAETCGVIMPVYA